MVDPTRPTPPNTPLAGGPLIALGAIGGAAIGFYVGEATPGFLIGIGIGALAAAAIWWVQRPR